jgi:hypothetical protein
LRIQYVVLCILGISALVGVGEYAYRAVQEAPRVLRAGAEKYIDVAVDRQHFSLMVEVGSGHNFITEHQKSKEDERDLWRSGKAAALIKYSRLYDKSLADGTIVHIPSNAPCQEIQRESFYGSSTFPLGFNGERVDIVGIQIRILEGPHKGFEGWVFQSQVGTR